MVGGLAGNASWDGLCHCCTILADTNPGGCTGGYKHTWVAHLRQQLWLEIHSASRSVSVQFVRVCSIFFLRQPKHCHYFVLACLHRCSNIDNSIVLRFLFWTLYQKSQVSFTVTWIYKTFFIFVNLTTNCFINPQCSPHYHSRIIHWPVITSPLRFSTVHQRIWSPNFMM